MKKPRRRASDEPERDDGAGVREPRKPKPKKPGGAAAAEPEKTLAGVR